MNIVLKIETILNIRVEKACIYIFVIFFVLQ